MIRYKSAIAFLMMLSAPIMAQDFKTGVDAYRSGDYVTAINEWRPLAEIGNTGAQFLLGAVYYFGHSVTQDDGEATKWFRLAAEQGHSSAQYYLGFMYQNGRGVLQDNTLACMWFNIAAENKSEIGRENQYVIANKMAPAEVKKARDMAIECIHSNYRNCGY